MAGKTGVAGSECHAVRHAPAVAITKRAPQVPVDVPERADTEVQLRLGIRTETRTIGL